MRRKEKEIADRDKINEILSNGDICRLAIFDSDFPYIVPMNYGYKEGILYFHSAREGRKINLLKKNPRVGFEIDADTSLISGQNACSWTMNFNSLIGTGSIEFIEEKEEKAEALDIIMSQYAEGSDFKYSESALEKVAVLKLPIREISGKRSFR